MTSPPSPQKPQVEDAFTRLTPPPGGLQRLRTALNAHEEPRPRLTARKQWAILAALSVLINAVAAAIALAPAAWIWWAVGGFDDATPPNSPNTITVVLVETPAPLPQTLTLDPRWKASLPSLPDAILAPSLPPPDPLLAVDLSHDSAVAFYWTEPKLTPNPRQ